MPEAGRPMDPTDPTADGGDVDLESFRDLAHRMFDRIPPRFRAGVRALRVDRSVEPHPEIPGIYTLGECWSEEWPSFGDEGGVQSDLHLYHGSFRALAREDPRLDWEAELWETILHELLHHREAAAGTDELGAVDWAEDQNQRRYEGLDWDPSFVLGIPEAEDGVRRLESEIFVEGTVEQADAVGPPSEERGEAGGRESTVAFRWRGERYELRIPAAPGWTYVRVPNLAGGRLWVVVQVKESLWRRLLGLARGEARHAEAPARRAKREAAS